MREVCAGITFWLEKFCSFWIVLVFSFFYCFQGVLSMESNLEQAESSDSSTV